MQFLLLRQFVGGNNRSSRLGGYRVAKIACSIVVFLLLFPDAVVRQGPGVDWEKQKAESLCHYRSLLQLDSSNPPGNETVVVVYLKRVFESEGIPVKTFAVDSARALGRHDRESEQGRPSEADPGPPLVAAIR